VVPRGLLAIGKIVKAFGVRGELIVTPLTDQPARFRKISAVFVGPDDEFVERYDVDRTAVEHRGVRLSLKGIDDRTAAERVVGNYLFVEPEQRIKLPKGRYFVHDLIGLSVVDEQGGTIGTVKDVLKFPAQDVYLVDRSGRQVMIPAVKEFIRSIDIRSRTMTVRLIDGMIEDDDAETVRED
jgi:16S rRNA processing protein RimM